ncbi:hypothetical protein LC040_04330 [Bacillus tianshenii]|nr:hypothetical protein LC040_04330 [Bacillus tianshenii]
MFDKFLDAEKPSFLRKGFNTITSAVGTDINRRFENIVGGMPCEIVKHERSLFRGNYQIYVLHKQR